MAMDAGATRLRVAEGRSRRSRRGRRSRAEWALRLGLAIAVMLLGWFATARTLGYAVRGTDPDRGLVLAPGDGRIAAVAAQRLSSQPDATAVDRARADRLAQDALQRDPTAVGAVVSLGLDAQVRGQDANARRLFGYAQKLSRRELSAQVWAIENAVARGDVGQALHHYDVALRTRREAAELLFPVLASAIADPAIRAALTRTMAGRPAWGPAFVTFAPGNADPVATADLFRELRRAGIAVDEDARAQIIGKLVSEGFLNDAWSYYASIRPGVDRRRSRDTRFSANLQAPTPFDWVPLNEGGVSSSIQRTGNGGVFDFVAPASVGGQALRQMQLLPPGEYRLVGRSTGVSQLPQSRPFWLLACKDGRELGRVDVNNSDQDGGVFSGRLLVPGGCPVQVLSFVVRSSDAVAGSSGQIEQVRLAAMQ